MEPFPCKNLLDRRIFYRFHGEMCASRTFYVSRRDMATGKYRRILASKEGALRITEDSALKVWRAIRCAVLVNRLLVQPQT